MKRQIYQTFGKEIKYKMIKIASQLNISLE